MKLDMKDTSRKFFAKLAALNEVYFFATLVSLASTVMVHVMVSVFLLSFVSNLASAAMCTVIVMFLTVIFVLGATLPISAWMRYSQWRRRDADYEEKVDMLETTAYWQLMAYECLLPRVLVTESHWLSGLFHKSRQT